MGRLTPTIAQYRSVLIIVTFHCLRHVAEEISHSFELSRSRQDHVPALTFNEEQAIVTYAKILGAQQLGLLMTRVFDEEISVQIKLPSPGV